MEFINNYLTQALDKLNDKGVTGQKETVMAPAVRKALSQFCRQDDEFSQAVVQGGSFPECMKAVAKGVGSSISDLDAYKKAVQFYFPGAEISMQMTIDLIGAAGKESPAATGPEEPKSMVLDLLDFI